MTTANDVSLLAEVLACEIRVWQALVDGDSAADMAALDASFLASIRLGLPIKRIMLGS